MKRVALGDRVFYIEHRWKLSLAFFLVALALVAIPGALLPRNQWKDDLVQPAIYAGCALLVALLVREQRVLTIDPARGSLVLSERRMVGRTRHRELPLRGLRVHTSSVEDRVPFSGQDRRYFIWLESPEQGRVLFLESLGDLARVQDQVDQLSRDIGRGQAG